MKHYFLYVITNCNGMASSSYLLYCMSLPDMIEQAEELIERETGVSQKDNNGLHTRIHCAEDLKGYAVVIEDVSFHFSVYTNRMTLKFLVDDLWFDTGCDDGEEDLGEEPKEEEDPFFLTFGGYAETRSAEDPKAELRRMIGSLPDVADDPEKCSFYVRKINESLAKKNAFDIEI